MHKNSKSVGEWYNICTVYRECCNRSFPLLSLFWMDTYIWVHTQSLFLWIPSFFLYLVLCIHLWSIPRESLQGILTFPIRKKKTVSILIERRLVSRWVFCMGYSRRLISRPFRWAAPKCNSHRLSSVISRVCLLLVFSQLCHILPSGIQPLG